MGTRDEIVAANLSLGKAIAAGEAAAAADHYTLDARLFPPGVPRLNGRSEIQDFFAKGMDAGVLSGMALDTNDVEEHGDVAIEVGRWSTATDAGKYVVVWKRTSDGLKLNLDIFNSDTLPAG